MYLNFKLFAYIFKYSFIYLLAMLGLCCCVGSSLVVVSGDHSSLWSVGFSLPAVASLVGEHTLWGTHASVLVASGFVHGLSSSAACGILPNQGSNPCLLHWQGDSLPLSHQGRPCLHFIILGQFLHIVLQHEFFK